MIAVEPVPGQPLIVILSGLPGSGKSHFARRLTAASDAVHVQTDAIRRSLFADRTYSDDEHQAVYAAMLAAVAAAIGRRRHVIVDATMLHDSAREPVVNLARSAGAGVAIVHIEARPSVVARRLARRAATADSGEQSEAGIRVYELLRPAYRRTRLPHWRVRTRQEADQAIDAIVAAMTIPAGPLASPSD